MRRCNRILPASFIGVLSAVLFVAATSSSLHAAASSGSRPNIVIIMADDMGFSDIGCYGSEIATPNLDRLARGGLRFTQFYNAARCCPTRAALLTGLYPHQAGVGHMMEDRGREGYRGELNRRCVTIAEVLRTAGYHTLMSGKWHVTPAPSASKDNWPRQRGFDRFYGTIHGAGSFYDPVTLTRDNTPIEPESKDFYYTDAISDHAVRFINDVADSDRPFFLYVPYTSPHWPLHARPADIARYRGKYARGWDALRRQRHQRMIKMGLVDAHWPMTPRDERVPAWEDQSDQDWWALCMAVYAAQIDVMDQGIGRIVATLEATHQLENTLILFLADNGGCAERLGPRSGGLSVPKTTRDGRPVRRGNDPSIAPGPDDTYASYGIGWANASNTPFRRYKHWVHEGGIASPLIVHWPAVVGRGGRITQQVGHLIDLMATCADVAGAAYPKRFNDNDIIPLEGKSLAPIFHGQVRPGHEALFWEHEGNRAVRRGRFKLVSRFPNEWELYDLQADRTEMNNLATTRPEKVAELASLYKAWAARSFVESWEDVRRARR